MNKALIRQKFVGKPLAMLPEYAEDIQQLDGDNILAESQAYIREFEAGADRTAMVGVVSVNGLMLNRGANVGEWGITCYEGLRDLLETMAPDYDALILDIDTGGGEAAGCMQFAEWLHNFSETNTPVHAVATHAYSAGYAIASACKTITAAEDSGLGSIGVIAMHVDTQKFYEDIGFDFQVFKYGDKKDAWSGLRDLTDAEKSEIQSGVDETGDRFTQLVADHRNLSFDTVRGYQAGTFIGRSALKAGLCDHIVPSIQDAFTHLATEVITMTQETQVTDQVAAETGEPEANAPESGKETVQEPEAVKETIAQPETPAAQAPDYSAAQAVAAMCESQGLAASSYVGMLASGKSQAQVFESIQEAKAAEREINNNNIANTMSDDDQQAADLLAHAPEVR